jgi:tetratricopeptide (TPR) repeat protein
MRKIFVGVRPLHALLQGVFLLPGATLAHAADEGIFLNDAAPRLEQSVRAGRNAMWTLPNEATQYRPAIATPVMRLAMQAQTEGRYLDAVSQVDRATQNKDDASLDLLRASLYLQGSQAKQAETLLLPLRSNPASAADAYALSAMAALQLGNLDQALAEAERARAAGQDKLPTLALTYALQGKGRLAEARAAAHALNAAHPGFAIGLAREAELALTQNDVADARQLIVQARDIEASQPYVVAVSGLVWLIGGETQQAKAAFQTALKRDPMDAKALMGLGLAEVRLGNLKAGQQALQAANQSDPDNAMVLTYLGRVQQQLGQTQQARVSWRQAQQIDPNDPTPWLYLSQAQLQANEPAAARASLQQAQARSGARAVYRGDLLLQQDALLLQANLAETQRKLGLDELAFQTLADTGDNSAVTLKNQAEILQGARFGESARRSLVLQSLFNDQPGALPVGLDVYGDGAGQSGQGTPQHGVVSGLTAAAPSYNDYGALFNRGNTLQVDGIVGGASSWGEQVKLGVGSDKLGVSLAQMQYSTNGFTPFTNLDNTVWQGVVQWRPAEHTQAFVLYENFVSKRGESFQQGDPVNGESFLIGDHSQVVRLGVRHTFGGGDEVRALLSQQYSKEQVEHFALYDLSNPYIFALSETGSQANGVDVQYRTQRFGQQLQLGAQAFQSSAKYDFPLQGFSFNGVIRTRQVYLAGQRQFNPQWKLDWGLGWGTSENPLSFSSTPVAVHRWLPRLGVVYTPDAATHVRFAAWQSLGMNSVGDADLAPVSVAGILQARPGDSGTISYVVRSWAVGADHQLAQDWLVAANAQTRKRGTPVDFGNGSTSFLYQNTDTAKLTLQWLPQRVPVSIGLSGEYEKNNNDSQ